MANLEYRGLMFSGLETEIAGITSWILQTPPCVALGANTADCQALVG